MKYLLYATLIMGAISCKKDTDVATPPSQVHYKDLSTRIVNITTPAGIDIGGDASSDLYFDSYHTGDDVNKQDIHRFVVSTGEKGKLLVNDQNTSPVFIKGSNLKTKGNGEHLWKGAVAVELATRTLVWNTANPTWEGNWWQADHKYLAVQVEENGKVYNGWVELSFDAARDRVILHRSGISKEAGKDIIVGE